MALHRRLHPQPQPPMRSPPFRPSRLPPSTFPSALDLTLSLALHTCTHAGRRARSRSHNTPRLAPFSQHVLLLASRSLSCAYCQQAVATSSQWLSARVSAVRSCALGRLKYLVPGCAAASLPLLTPFVLPLLLLPLLLVSQTIHLSSAQLLVELPFPSPANRLFFPCLNPSQSSHESVDSGCCDAEGSLNTCSKVFNTFSLINTPSQQQQQAPFPSHSTPPKRPPLTKPRSSMKKDETTTPTAKAAETAQTGGGASYKYLTWREKDRRRRFREEWKHLWLVVPHGMYEVMCLVCHKIMTQRKLDTIKRHTIRRHAELLSMSETERQRLYHDLVTQYFRRGGDFCGESDPFCSTSVPRLRQTGTRGSRMEVAGVRRHSRLTDVPSPFRARMSAPRRSEIDTHPLASSPPSVQTSMSLLPPPPPPPPLPPPLLPTQSDTAALLLNR
ncbi:asparagine-rich protein [Echinococcus granulosus]|uniref:Asparagine-rich protein n=1 Tax=Echinococcus granulosus TaxID=6210 RepID=W6UE03_ECHGR|nr:asparagine-rich protein [Echinococcus granulosus]EUB59278.1 asparagine-rich protein [Echinococcus granulosus]